MPLSKEIKDRIAKEAESLPGEQWRPIASTDGKYEISSLGRVKRLPDYRQTFVSIRKCTISGYGYYQARLGNKQKYVHILVAEAFIPNPKGRKHVNHINGNKLDNRVENLEWCTHAENMKHIHLIGGVDFKQQKITDTLVAEIRSRITGDNDVELSKEFGISREHIRDLRTGKRRVDVYVALRREMERSAGLVEALEKLSQFGGYVATVATEALTKYFNSK